MAARQVTRPIRRHCRLTKSRTSSNGSVAAPESPSITGLYCANCPATFIKNSSIALRCSFSEVRKHCGLLTCELGIRERQQAYESSAADLKFLLSDSSN